MKYLGVILLLFFVFSVDAWLDDEGDLPAEFSAISHILKKIFHTSCNKSDDFLSQTNPLFVCFKGDLNIAYNKTLRQKNCMRQMIIQNCQKKALDKLKSCMIEDYQDIPNEIKLYFQEFFDYQCTKPLQEVSQYHNNFITCLKSLELSLPACSANGESLPIKYLENIPDEELYKCSCGKVDIYSRCFNNTIKNETIRKANERFVTLLRKLYSMDTYNCTLSEEPSITNPSAMSKMSTLSLFTILLMAFVTEKLSRQLLKIN